MGKFMRRFAVLFIALATIVTHAAPAAAQAGRRPNVILIMSDDQGYGEIGAHGNTVIRTPNLDALYTQSVRLTDYHVDPTCSPTRSALMTGRYSTRTGVWHTINGRSLMAPDEYTIAEYFRDNGYRTAMFGKWHLGDNAPLRPSDQGFEHVVYHPGGGIDQGASYLGNDYFDDTYLVDGQWQAFEGYCTDVWFSEAMRYIDGAADDDERPFFIYLPTNAPHGPWNVDPRYAQPYIDAGVPANNSRFYGMIENIDENVGRLRAWLDEQGLAENTIFIFTTDNGTAGGVFNNEATGVTGFNAGMRGQKGSEYEGGHRVPFFIHWPAGGLVEGRDVDLLSAHIDVLPTLGELAGLAPIDEANLPRGPIDGRSLAPVITGVNLVEPTGVRFVHSQRTSDPIMWRKCAVMTEQWRLVNGTELYDIVADPGQENDIAADHADVVAQLRGEYEGWWQSLSPVFDDVVRFDLGGAENPTTLMSHDWLMEGTTPSIWHHSYVMRNDLRNGPFMVNVVRAGTYRITPMRWPEYVDRPSGCVHANVSFENADEINVNGSSTNPEEHSTGLEMQLPAGPASLTATLTRADGETFGAYYVKIELIQADEAP